MLVRAYLGCGSAAAAGVAEPHCAIGPPFSKQNQSSLKDSPSWPLFWLFMFVCLFVGGFFFAMFRSVFWFLLACFPTRLVINQYESCQSICNLCGGGQPRNAGLPNPIGPCGRCRRNLDASLSFMAREKGQKNVVPSLKEDVSADADWIVIDYFVIVSLR